MPQIAAMIQSIPIEVSAELAKKLPFSRTELVESMRPAGLWRQVPMQDHNSADRHLAVL